MRDIYDQIYYPSSVVSSTSVQESKRTGLGRLLGKLSRSKTDVNAGKRYGDGSFEDEDFRLTRPSLNPRENQSSSEYSVPFDQQISNSSSNMRAKDPGRNHSWIYNGNGEIPQHPQGYGQYASPSGYFSGRPGGFQGPPKRCKMLEGSEDDFSCCACGPGHGLGHGTGPGHGPGHGGMSYVGNPSPYQVPGGFYGTGGGCPCSAKEETTKDKLVGSVRKLTWKSLKAAVKKRPSLDVMRRQTIIGGVPPLSATSKELLHANFGLEKYPQGSRDDFSAPSYFFPDKKKSFFASCNDLLHGREMHNATASVRVRPKRTRASWNFQNEFGPVPNYVQDEVGVVPDSLYHSEWDLRQIMPYDLWINTSSTKGVKKKPGNSEGEVNQVQRKPSILDKDHKSAYQLLKKGGNGSNFKKNSSSRPAEEVEDEEVSEEDVGSDDALTSSSSDQSQPSSTTRSLSSNAGGDDPTIRIAGQGMYTAYNGLGPNNKDPGPKRSTNSLVRSVKNPINSTKNGSTPPHDQNNSEIKEIHRRVIDSNSIPQPPPSPNAKLESKTNRNPQNSHTNGSPSSFKPFVDSDNAPPRTRNNYKPQGETLNSSPSKYGALRRVPRSSQITLMRETIVEETGSDNEGLYSVKIIVHPNEYVKPILKKCSSSVSMYDAVGRYQYSSKGKDNEEPEDQEDVEDSPERTKGVTTIKKKVQFGSEDTVVLCSGRSGSETEETEEEEEEEDVGFSAGEPAKSQETDQNASEGTVKPQPEPDGNVNDLAEALRKELDARAARRRKEQGGGDARSCQPSQVETQRPVQLEEQVAKSKGKVSPPSKPNQSILKSAIKGSALKTPNPRGIGTDLRIINPNSLLFNDTTRIRLNQTRPTLSDTTFDNMTVKPGSMDKKNPGKRSSVTTSPRVKQSNSFRMVQSSSNLTPLRSLRPNVPPPPPPSSLKGLPNVPPVPKRTGSVDVALVNAKPINRRPTPKAIDSNSKSQYKNPLALAMNSLQNRMNPKQVNPNVNSTAATPKPKISAPLEASNRQKQTQFPKSSRKVSHEQDQNIEIVQRDNSVSEIRIYSGSKALTVPAFDENTLTSGESSRNHSSVVLIGVNQDEVTGSRVKPNHGKEIPLKEASRGSSIMGKLGNLPPPPVPMSQTQSKGFKGAPKKEDPTPEPLYDDILGQNRPKTSPGGDTSSLNSLKRLTSLNEELKNKINEKKAAKESQVPQPQVPTTPKPPPTSPVKIPKLSNKEKEGYSSSPQLPPLIEELYNDVGPVKDTDSAVIYDDTLSLMVHRSVLNGEEPLYDDVFNFMGGNGQESDSGAETEDSTPPPLPNSSPPALPKASSELPPLPFPLLTTPRPQTGIPRPGGSLQVVPKEKEAGKSAESEEVLSKTRSLLNELSDRLSQLNFPPTPPPQGHPQPPSSSSESSGVEEDYNSEKNYSPDSHSSGSSGDYNHRLSKLVTDTISMARGKFLDSMKATPGPSSTPSGPNVVEEPIYEEIPGDLSARSSSPIYSDAFDAKTNPTSIFDGASRTEILTFLESIRDRLAESNNSSTESRSSSLGSSSSGGDGVKIQTKTISGEVKVERNDSGVGSSSEASSLITVVLPQGKHPLPLPPVYLPPTPAPSLCEECHQESTVESSPAGSKDPLCSNCVRRQSERKEILLEVYETEVKYGRDLRIILDEFYTPIQTAGLLSKEQLDAIFLNVDQLMEINEELVRMLRSEFEGAASTLDEDLFNVNVGRIFYNFGERMMTAFESYCTRQASAGALLTQLEKEKELLRIFLRVSQMENAVLRRMNLPAFLMVPVQRVTRYPLLLARLLKVTPNSHFSREELESAQEKIELHLEHMNKTTREVSSVRLWRRISIINNASSSLSAASSSSSPHHRRSSSEIDGVNIRIRKLALDLLEWTNLSDIHIVLESQLSLVHMNGGKPLRNIFGILLARGKDLEQLALKIEASSDLFFPPAGDPVRDVKLVLVRVKNTRFCPLREPLCLSKCIVSGGEGEFADFIEINEIITKNTYFLQVCRILEEAKEWALKYNDFSLEKTCTILHI